MKVIDLLVRSTFYDKQERFQNCVILEKIELYLSFV